MKLINKKNSRKQGIIEIYGIHAVRAAIKNTRRKYKKLTISENLRSFITPEIKKNVEKINQVPNKEMFKLHGAENNHQGIVLSTSALSQPSLDEILENSKFFIDSRSTISKYFLKKVICFRKLLLNSG